MKVLQLTIENFLSIEDAVLSLADRGLVLIQGVNEDNTSAHSNGSGKSSIPDALCWCLYGVTARGVSGDAVINRATGKNCRVQVTIQDGDHRYLIDRYRKHATGKNGLQISQFDAAGVATVLTKGTDKLTQEVVEQIIGSSYDVFRAAVYAGQEAMPDLPAMTDKQLKILVEEAAGVTVLEAAYREALLKVRLQEDELERTQNEVATLMVKLDGLKSTVTDYRKGQKDFEAQRKLDLDHLGSEMERIGDAVLAVTKNIAKFDETKLLDEIKGLELKVAAVADERRKEKLLEKTLRDEELAFVTITAKVKGWKEKYDRAKVNLDNCASLVGTCCSECDKLYREEDLADQRSRLEHALKEVADQAPEIKKLVEDAKGRVAKARETLEHYRATMTDVSATSAQIASLRDELDQLRVLQKDLSGWMRDEAATLANYKRRKAETNPFNDLILKTEADIIAAQKLYADTQARGDEIEKELHNAEIVAKVFSPAGVRAHILDEVTPFLNDQTAKYLASLTDGNTTATWSTLIKTAKGELREKFTIEVADATGGESFAALSGGEKRKVRIAASLALQDLVARRASKPIELFIGDEIDDALDEAGLERLTGILEEKARERGSVFIISHNSLTDWVPAAITVTKKDGKSVVIDEVA